MALIVGAFALSCSGAGVEGDADSNAQPVIGGRREGDLLAAGYLVREGVASCSAVLVEPDLVLTVAHCVDGHQDIAFGWGEVGENTPVRSTAHAVHPRYIMPPKNGGVSFQGFDVALLRLERPAGVEPAPLGSARRFGKVRAIGYGATSYVAGESGKLEPHGVGTDRRSIVGTILSQNATEIFVRFDPGMSACYGDSGGPLFTEDGTVVAVLSRFTEIGRCLPKDRSLMGYVRVDAMEPFFREAKACLLEQDVPSCLREDTRGLCDVPRFDNRGTPRVVEPSEGDLRAGSATFDLSDHEERSLTIAPAANVELTLSSRGDARMRVVPDGQPEPLVERSNTADLQKGKTYAVVIGSCNGAKQSVTLAWRPRPELLVE
jgi:hypothetical protein